MSSQHSLTAGCGGAVNGNTTGVYKTNGTNCIHTSSKFLTSWWEVNLGRSYPVHSITVWARGENPDYLFRMEGIEITMDGKECYKFDSAPTKREIAINCSSGVLSGTVIRVYKNATAAGIQRPNHTINICEFQVFSCSDGYWGIDCQQECGNCSNSEACDKVTGHCSSCSPRLEQPLCRAVEKTEIDGTSQFWIVVGASLAAVVLLAIAVAVVVLTVKWRRSRSETATEPEQNSGEDSKISNAAASQSERPGTMQYLPADAHDYLEIIPGPIYNQLQTSQDTRDSHFYSALQTVRVS
ncbi:hypothetical protein V1264_024440 [Littorina saxatilis]|uniref:Fucolectin-related molecule n=2 Tax=Littorina saxatilis TaxID=31220 RepID=A0AAN9FYZ3_9CAEN